jgi:flavin-binding protein dodecin
LGTIQEHSLRNTICAMPNGLRRDTAERGDDGATEGCAAALAAAKCQTPATPWSRVVVRAYDRSLGEAVMNEHVYKTIEITGSSQKGTDDAVRVAIEKAAQTVHNLRWFKVAETRGCVENGKISYWQVTLDVAFTLE